MCLSQPKSIPSRLSVVLILCVDLAKIHVHIASKILFLAVAGKVFLVEIIM